MNILDLIAFVGGALGAILIGFKNKWAFVFYAIGSIATGLLAYSNGYIGLLSVSIFFLLIDIFWFIKWSLDEKKIMWHYQSMRHTYTEGTNTEYWYSIHEFYPNDNKNIFENKIGGWTVNEIAPKGSTNKELIKELQLMIKDIKKYGIRDYNTGELLEE